MQKYKIQIGHLILNDFSQIEVGQKWIEKDNNAIIEIVNIENDLITFKYSYWMKGKHSITTSDFRPKFSYILIENFVEDIGKDNLISAVAEICNYDWSDFQQLISLTNSQFNCDAFEIILDKMKENSIGDYNGTIEFLSEYLKQNGYMIVLPDNLNERIELETILNSYNKI